MISVFLVIDVVKYGEEYYGNAKEAQEEQSHVDWY